MYVLNYDILRYIHNRLKYFSICIACFPVIQQDQHPVIRRLTAALRVKCALIQYDAPFAAALLTGYHLCGKFPQIRILVVELSCLHHSASLMAASRSSYLSYAGMSG